MLVAVVSDIHGNLAAFNAVLADLPTVDEIWCLGDIVGYGPDPNECLETLLHRKHVSLAGNHDWACVGKVDVGAFNADARWACQWTADQLTEANREILSRLPNEMVIGDFTLAHGSPRDPIWEYLLYPSQAAVNLSFFETKYALVGHTHVPMVFLGPWGQEKGGFVHPNTEVPIPLGERRLILNPGSVGQPRDGDPRAAYALLDLEQRLAHFRRVKYDIEATQAKMRRAGLPRPLWARLSFGW